MGKYEDDWMSRAVDITDQENQASTNDDWMSRAVDITDQENHANQANHAKPDVSGTESYIRGAAQEGTFNTADELAAAYEAVKDWYRNDPMSFKEAYNTHLDESRLKYQQAQEANPGKYLAGQVTGGLALSLAPGINAVKGASVANAVGKNALQGAASAFGASEAKNTTDLLEDVSKGAAFSGTLGGVGQKLTGQGMKEFAEEKALNAVGATGKQLGNMADDTGRFLLDNRMIRVGDTVEDVSKRLGQAVTDTGNQIDTVVNELSRNGKTVNLSMTLNGLDQEIKSLEKLPANDKLVESLRRERERITKFIEKNGELIPLRDANESKKVFQNATNYNNEEFEKKTSAILARHFKESVDNAVAAYDNAFHASIPNQALDAVSPDSRGITGRLLSDFKDLKKSYGRLEPAREAAESRVNQIKQSPVGGLGDLAAATAGSFAGIPGALGGIALKRAVLPRATTTAAVLADGLGDVLNKTPEVFGKFAPILKSAAARGTSSLTATHHMLQQTSEEYRNLLKEGDDGEQ